MFRQSGTWHVGWALALGLAVAVQSSQAADYYFGNMEEDVQFNGLYILDRAAEGYAGWFDWEYDSLPPKNQSPSTTIGVTTGTYSMAYQPAGDGFDQGLAVNLQDLPSATSSAAFDALLTHTQMAMNMSWDNDEWYAQFGGSGWNGAKVELVINFGPDGGYYTMGAPDIDTGNPGEYRGYWDLDNYPGVHTRVMTWDYSEYLPAIQALADAGTLSDTAGWVEFMLQTTIGDFILPVTFYTDSWRFTGDIVVPGLDGDYNENDTIDAADYTVWRDVFSAGGTELPNDPTPGTVDETDYDYWKTNFGAIVGAGAASDVASVPEPATSLLAAVALALVAMGLRRSR